MNRKKLWTGLLAAAGMLVLILDSKTAANAAAEGVELCIRTVIPSLFPFFLLTMVISDALTGTTSSLLRFLSNLFQIPAGGEGLLISGFLGGYPTGAQSVAIAYESRQITKETADRLLRFCSNAGPAFLFGMAGTLFQEIRTSWALWGIHIASAYLVSRMSLPKNENTHIKPNQTRKNIPQMLRLAIQAMACVCGWVVLFRVLIAFLQRWFLWIFPDSVQILLIGILELTNGCCSLHRIESEALRFVVCSVLLSFGGFCVVMQTQSAAAGLSLKSYLIGKLQQGLFSLILSSAFVYGHWTYPCLLIPILSVLLRKKQNKGSNPRLLGV